MVPWTPILIWVSLSSVVAFVTVVYDKFLAKSGGRRVRERLLLGMAAVGGSPGLVVAMLLVRHKTRKISFLGPLILILAIHAGLVAWLLQSD